MACARPDATADGAHLEAHLPSADGAEKLADRARDALAPDARCRRSELQAAPEAALAALEPCKPVVAQSAEQSSAALEAQMEEQPDAPQPERWAECSPKLLETFPRTGSLPPVGA